MRSTDAFYAEEHPGAHDRAYWHRRDEINAAIDNRPPGTPIPIVDYLDVENSVWREVSSALAERHRQHACAAFLQAKRSLDLPTDGVPQLYDVDRRLGELTAFHLRPVAGLVPTREFYGALADRVFCSTQYVRHHDAPFYTPEPDIVHELIGHAAMLADPHLADLYEAAGRASLAARTEDALDFFSRVFWFTLEFGVVLEAGTPKAYGAGLLSSYGEIERFDRAELRPFNLGEMGVRTYDISHYQPVLYLAPSFTEMVDRLGRFWSDFDDEHYAELAAGG
jgi:phenylalanine-4-hydroxylase